MQNTGQIESGSRIDRVFLIVLVLLFFSITIKSLLYRLPGKLDFRKASLFFIGLYSFYAIVSAPDINRLFSYLPTILYVFLSVSYFFDLSFNDKITKKQIVLFYLAFTIIALLGFMKVYTHKYNALESAYYMQSNGMGYLFVLLLPAITFLFSSRKVISLVLSAIFLIIIVNSAKRGAILTGTACFAYLIFNLYKNSKLSLRIIMVILILMVVTGLILYLTSHESLLYRFQLEGGSGRDSLYITLWENWYNGDFKTLLFGNGFFTSHELAGGLMAHNDWLQVLSDMGLLGLISYLIVFISFASKRSIVKYYKPSLLLTFDLCLLIWLIKSMISGVLMDKGALILFSYMGIILGYTYRAQRTHNTQPDVKTKMHGQITI